MEHLFTLDLEPGQEPVRLVGPLAIRNAGPGMVTLQESGRIFSVPLNCLGTASGDVAVSCSGDVARVEVHGGAPVVTSAPATLAPDQPEPEAAGATIEGAHPERKEQPLDTQESRGGKRRWSLAKND